MKSCKIIHIFTLRKKQESTENEYQHIFGGDIMAENKSQDYFETDEEREEGHTDTRTRNHECENKDPHLGCNLGIDVAG